MKKHMTAAEKDAAFERLFGPPPEPMPEGQSWFEMTLEDISMWTRFEGTFEEARQKLEEKDWPAPPTPNAWGMVAQTAVKRGYLIETGQMGRMKSKASHGRRTPILRTKHDHDLREGSRSLETLAQPADHDAAAALPEEHSLGVHDAPDVQSEQRVVPRYPGGEDDSGDPSGPVRPGLLGSEPEGDAGG